MRISIPSLARATLFGLMLFTPLIFTSATLEAFETPKIALLQLAAILLAALAAIAASERAFRWQELRRDSVAIGAVAFALSAALSTVLSISPRTSFFGGIESLAGLTTLLSYLIVMWAAREFVANDESVRRLLFAVVISAGVVAVYALMQAFRLDPYPWETSSSVGGFVRPFATLGHANVLGGYLVTALPIAVYLAIRSQGVRRMACAAVSAASILAIGLTLTRGAWIALGALAMTGVIVLIRTNHRRAIGFAAFAAIALAASGWFASGPELQRGVTERLTHFADGAGRLSLWRSGLATAAAHPLCGAGLDTFAIAFGPHRVTEYWLSEWNTTPNRAHNMIVQILATQGGLGLASMTVLVVGVALAARRAWRSTTDRALVGAVAAGLFAFGMQSLFSFTTAATGALAAVMVGILARMGECRSMASSSRGGDGSMLRPGLRAVVMTALPVVAWFGVIRPLSADVTCRGAECLGRIDPVGAVTGYESAVARAPERDLLWFKLSQGARAAARATADPVRRRRLNDRARAAQETAVQLVPKHPAHRAHFARLLNELFLEGAAKGGEVSLAFHEAIQLDPQNPGLHGDAAYAAWARGNFMRAEKLARRGIELDPNLASLRAVAGLAAMAQGNFEEAEQQLFDAAARRDWHGNEDGQLQAISVRAACILRLNYPLWAEWLARSVLAERPDWPGPRYTLGFALALMGRHDEAAATYRELLARCPTHALAADARRELQKELAATKRR